MAKEIGVGEKNEKEERLKDLASWSSYTFLKAVNFIQVSLIFCNTPT